MKKKICKPVEENPSLKLDRLTVRHLNHPKVRAHSKAKGKGKRTKVRIFAERLGIFLRSWDADGETVPSCALPSPLPYPAAPTLKDTTSLTRVFCTGQIANQRRNIVGLDKRVGNRG